MLYSFINWFREILFGFEMNEDNDNSLHNRMKRLSLKWNGFHVHPFKPTIITLNSHDLLKFINILTSYDEKLKFFEQWNTVYKKVCESLYNKFNPTMIYYFNDEINIVFYHNDHGELWANGNLHKMIANISSYTSRCLSQELIKIGVNLDFCFNCRVVQFDDSYETLNWLIWRQSDCYRNILTLLYKCYHLEYAIRTNSNYLNQILNSKLKGTTTTELETFLYENKTDSLNEFKKLLFGAILKKQIRVISTQIENAETENTETEKSSTMYTRKEIVMFNNTKFADDFVNNFETFLQQRYLA